MSLCDNNCKTCRYLGVIAGGVGKICASQVYCNYLSTTGHRRPCPAGAACTVKETGRRISLNPRAGLKEPADCRRAKGTEVLQGRQTAALNRILREHGLTVAKLAEKLGMTSAAVHKWRRELYWANWGRMAEIGIRRPEDCPTKDDMLKKTGKGEN